MLTVLTVFTCFGSVAVELIILDLPLIYTDGYSGVPPNDKELLYSTLPLVVVIIFCSWWLMDVFDQ